MNITTLESLSALYAPAGGRSVMMELSALDAHSIGFISLSPFVVLSSSGAGGAMDASPRGGAPGFVCVMDAHTLLIADAPGNNRLDTLENIVRGGEQGGPLGLLFLVPGMDEMLRDQIGQHMGADLPVETQAQMLERYRQTL
jgi:uncharacterized protein